MREETGYSGDRAEPLGWVWPNPAIQENRCFTFLVRGARKDGPAEPDSYEQIEVVTRSLADVSGLISEGEIRHSLVIAAFGMLGVLRGPVSSEGGHR